MKELNKYIFEKLKINENFNDIDNIEEFIESFKGTTQKLIINLLIKCTIELEKHTYKEDHWCYILEEEINLSSNGYRGKNYSYSLNKDNTHLDIGEKYHDDKIIFIVKKGDEIPQKYL